MLNEHVSLDILEEQAFCKCQQNSKVLSLPAVTPTVRNSKWF